MAQDLAEQKRQLEIKRSMMNQVPPGSFQKMLDEHDKVYKAKKDQVQHEIDKKRKFERQAMIKHAKEAQKQRSVGKYNQARGLAGSENDARSQGGVELSDITKAIVEKNGSAKGSIPQMQ